MHLICKINFSWFSFVSNNVINCILLYETLLDTYIIKVLLHYSHLKKLHI